MDISVALIQGDPLLYHTFGCLSIGKINKIKNFLSIIFVTFSQNYRLGLFVQQYQNYKNFLTIFCNLCALTFFSLVFLNKKRPSSSGFFVQKVEKKCTKRRTDFVQSALLTRFISYFLVLLFFLDLLFFCKRKVRNSFFNCPNYFACLNHFFQQC